MTPSPHRAAITNPKPPTWPSAGWGFSLQNGQAGGSDKGRKKEQISTGKHRPLTKPQTGQGAILAPVVGAGEEQISAGKHRPLTKPQTGQGAILASVGGAEEEQISTGKHRPLTKPQTGQGAILAPTGGAGG